MKGGAAIFTLVGVVLFLFAHGMLSVLGMLCIVVAAVMFATTISGGASKLSKKQTQFADEMQAQGYKYALATREGSAIAVNPEQRLLFLRNDRMQSKQYPFDAVRTWRIHHQETGKSHVVPGYGFHSTMNAMGTQRLMNKESQRLDRSANGLFIDVRDINNPIWHIGLQSAEEQARWHEILTQYIQEGVGAATA